MLPKYLVGEAYGLSYFCPEWELRITARCLEEDLGQPRDTRFERLRKLPIVKALTRDRYDRAEDTRQVHPLSSTSGLPVWVLSHQDQRGGTLHDQEKRVIWLLASRRQRSGARDDFYP